MATQTSPIDAITVCDDFEQFARPVRERFKEMSARELFVTDAGDALFDKYLGAFPEGTNPVFRERSTHDCQTCKRFIRRLGGLVNIKNGEVVTVWGDLEQLPHPYKQVADALDRAVRAAAVTGVFRTKEKEFGEAHNYDPKTNEKYHHFHGAVAARHRANDPETKRGEKDAVFQVLKRGLTEIRNDHLTAVLGLIADNGLYRGEEHREALKGFQGLLNRFTAANSSVLFVWENLDHRFARFRNTVIGTLLTELAEGKDFDQAVKAFETKVAPANYKRPTAAITQGMVEKAVQTLTDLGLHGAPARRHARLSDVSVNDVLFVDNDARGRMKDGVAALLEGSVKRSPPDLKHAIKMPADAFVRDFLPGAKTLDLFLENRHAGNFVSLTGADGPERLFKWDNNFAWAYDGDVTDSVKQRVKAAGGKIDCLLRVSLSWFNFDDLDLHCLTPDNKHVHFRSKMGILDVDMNANYGTTRAPVENLAFDHLCDGVYKVWVNQFSRRETTDVGFAIETEFGGQVHQYSYAKALKTNEDVQCFTLHVKDRKLVKVETALTGGSSSQEKWGVKTETLVPVQLVCHSPNAWGGVAVGAKHLIFALKNCKNPDPVRGIFNEFLRSELQPHGKVFEYLSGKTKCAYSDDQISGVGFTAARGDSVTVVVDGKRAYTLTF